MRYLFLLLLLWSFSASSQTIKPGTVCVSITQANKINDSLRHLPTVRREALEWRLAYVNAKIAADTNAYAAKTYHQALLHSQVAFSGQQLLLNEQRAEKEKFRGRAHRKGWVIAGLLAAIGGYVFTR